MQSNGKKTSGPPIPATKIFQCGEGTRYFDQRALWRKSERMRPRDPPAVQNVVADLQIGDSSGSAEAQTNHANRLFPLEREAGMVQCRDTFRREAGMSPRSPERFSSRRSFVRRESQPV